MLEILYNTYITSKGGLDLMNILGSLLLIFFTVGGTAVIAALVLDIYNHFWRKEK